MERRKVTSVSLIGQCYFPVSMARPLCPPLVHQQILVMQDENGEMRPAARLRRAVCRRPFYGWIPTSLVDNDFVLSRIYCFDGKTVNNKSHFAGKTE